MLSTSSEPKTTLPSVYRHSRRECWGLAVVVWEREGKRLYRFEDGNERAFKEGYYHLFDRAPAVGDAAERLLASLTLDKAKPADPSAARRAARANRATWAELLAIFGELFPGGFMDAGWVRKVRGKGAKRRAKRHRNAAIAHAKELLGREALEALIAAGDSAEVLSRALAVLEATDLVTRTQLAPLKTSRPCPALAKELYAFLYEPDPKGEHFDRWVQRLGRAPEGTPSWPLVTALRALVRPIEHMYIRPSAFRALAEIVSPALARKVRPHGGYYNRCLDVAQKVLNSLEEHEELPRDLLDVHDFLWTVCRPSAAKVLARVRQQAAAANAQKDDEAPTNAEATPPGANDAPAETTDAQPAEEQAA